MVREDAALNAQLAGDLVERLHQRGQPLLVVLHIFPRQLQATGALGDPEADTPQRWQSLLETADFQFENLRQTRGVKVQLSRPEQVRNSFLDDRTDLNRERRKREHAPELDAVLTAQLRRLTKSVL